MSMTSSSDWPGRRLVQGQLFSHELQLDDSEWPDSNTLSQLSPVSSQGSLVEIPEHSMPRSGSAEDQNPQKADSSSTEGPQMSTRSKNNAVFGPERDEAPVQSHSSDCAESLAAETQYLQPDTDPSEHFTTAIRSVKYHGCTCLDDLMLYCM